MIFFFLVAKQTVKKQKAELEAITSKVTDLETLVSSKVCITLFFQFDFFVNLLETGKLIDTF